MKFKFAAQLYTLQNELKNNFPEILRKLAEMGWDGVQIDGLHGYSPEEIADVLKDTQLETAGMHVPLDRLENDLDAVLKEARLFHTKDIICPYLDDELQNEEKYRQVKQTLLEVAGRIEPLGYRLGYHNDDNYDFDIQIDNQKGLDYMLADEGDYTIYPEIDTFWVKDSGYSSFDIIKQYPNRMPNVHFKDMTDDERKTFTEVGNGSIDFESILKWGCQNGVEWYVVEQDECEGSPLDSLEISLNNLKGMAKKLESHE